MKTAEELARETADEYLHHHSKLGILEGRIRAALEAHEADVRADERAVMAAKLRKYRSSVAELSVNTTWDNDEVVATIDHLIVKIEASE